MGKFILCVVAIVVAFYVGRVWGWWDAAKVGTQMVDKGLITVNPQK